MEMEDDDYYEEFPSLVDLQEDTIVENANIKPFLLETPSSFPIPVTILVGFLGSGNIHKKIDVYL